MEPTKLILGLLIFRLSENSGRITLSVINKSVLVKIQLNSNLRFLLAVMISSVFTLKPALFKSSNGISTRVKLCLSVTNTFFLPSMIAAIVALIL